MTKTYTFDEFKALPKHRGVNDDLLYQRWKQHEAAKRGADIPVRSASARRNQRIMGQRISRRNENERSRRNERRDVEHRDKHFDKDELEYGVHALYGEQPPPPVLEAGMFQPKVIPCTKYRNVVTTCAATAAECRIAVMDKIADYDDTHCGRLGTAATSGTAFQFSTLATQQTATRQTPAAAKILASRLNVASLTLKYTDEPQDCKGTLYYGTVPIEGIGASTTVDEMIAFPGVKGVKLSSLIGHQLRICATKTSNEGNHFTGGNGGGYNIPFFIITGAKANATITYDLVMTGEALPDPADPSALYARSAALVGKRPTEAMEYISEVMNQSNAQGVIVADDSANWIKEVSGIVDRGFDFVKENGDTILNAGKFLASMLI